jgi:DNA-binding response OmpR family regulator
MDQLAAPRLCPCCKRPIAELKARQLLFLRFPPEATVTPAILSILVHARGRSVSLETLTIHAYEARPNGEPECAAESVKVLIGRLRRRLKPLGWTITDARHSDGYRLEQWPGGK